jgi:hypothetical protein
MPSKSNVSIHLTTVGDVNIEQMVTCAENLNAPAMVDNYVIPPATPTAINRPNLVGFVTTGVMIIPPKNNTYEFNFGPGPGQLGVRFHPSNPSFVSLSTQTADPIFLNHIAPSPLTFIFIWV